MLLIIEVPGEWLRRSASERYITLDLRSKTKVGNVELRIENVELRV